MSAVHKKNCSEWFVHSVAFPVAVNHGMHGSQLSQSDSAPPSFSNGRENGHQSTHNITTKFLPADEGVHAPHRDVVAQASPTLLTYHSEQGSARGSRVWGNEG